MEGEVYRFNSLTVHSSTIDPDDLVQCPYDPNHKIRKSRLQYHLIDCKNNNPVAKKTKKKLKTCPFNSTHIIASHEFEHHKSICPDQSMVHSSIMQDSVKSSRHEMPIVNHHISCLEDNWDDEVTVITSTEFYPRLPQTEPLAQRVKSNVQQGRVTAPSDQLPLSRPPFSSSGFGRGALVPPNADETSCSTQNQRVGNGVRLATSSVGFNLETMIGKPSNPQTKNLNGGSSGEKDSVANDIIMQTTLDAVKEEKKLKKKLKAIQQLEAEMAAGKKLDKDQLMKVKGKDEVVQKLALLR